MYNTEKKFRRSAITTIGYVLAALMLIYTCYQIGNTVHTINEYYAQYGMKATPLEYLTYVGQNALNPLIYAALLFLISAVHNEVRKNNPANYLSDEDIVEADAAKKAAKEAKQVRKGDEAAAKAGHEPVAEEAVVADFTTETEAAAEKAKPGKPEPKTEKKPEAKDAEDKKKTASEKKEDVKAENKDDVKSEKTEKKDDSKTEKKDDRQAKGSAPKSSSGKKKTGSSKKPQKKKEPKTEENGKEE